MIKNINTIPPTQNNGKIPEDNKNVHLNWQLRPQASQFSNNNNNNGNFIEIIYVYIQL